MTHDWLENPDAVAHVKRVLMKTGVPLEAQVERICNDHERWFDRLTFDGSTFATGRMLYGSMNAEAALREVDQCISTQITVDVNEKGNDFRDVAIDMEVLIECKHRDGLAIFGFPYQSRITRSPTYPVISELAVTTLLEQLDPMPAFLRAQPLCTIGMLDNMQKTPRVSDEQLIYKAGASLYDSIRFLAEPYRQMEADPLVDELGITDAFRAYAQTRFWPSAATARQWLRNNVAEDTLQRFNQQYEEHHRGSIPGLSVYVPVVCVDAPLYYVDIEDDGMIQEITPADYLLTSLRLPNWPGPLRSHLTHPRPEALLTIVAVEALPSFLDQLAHWLQDLGVFLACRDERAVQWLFIEMAFLQSVQEHITVGELVDARWLM